MDFEFIPLLGLISSVPLGKCLKLSEPPLFSAIGHLGGSNEMISVGV